MLSLGILLVIAVVVVTAAARSRDDRPDHADELAERLDDWCRAGLLTPDAAERIGAFEAERARREGLGGDDRRGMMAEGVGYTGAALAVGALALLLSDVWQQLVVGGRLALVTLLTVLVGVGGAFLHPSDRPPMQRLGGVLFAAMVLGTAWATFIVADGVLLLGGADLGVLVAAGAVLVALPVYLLRRRSLAQLVLFVSAATLVGALLARPALEVAPVWVGLVFWALGTAWLLLGLGHWVAPAVTAEVLGGTTALLAAQVASFDTARPWLLWLGLLTAASLVALGVARDRVHDLAVGAVGLFAFAPQLVFELFGDAIGGPAMLLVVGLLLVVLAVGLGRARREVRS